MKKFALPSLWELAIAVQSIKTSLRSTGVPHIGLDLESNPVPYDSSPATDQDTSVMKPSGDGLLAESNGSGADGSSDI